MQLSQIIEAILIASEAPITSEGLCTLILARVEEVAEEKAASTPLPDDMTQLEGLTPDEIDEAIAGLNESYQAQGHAFSITERPKGWKIYTRAEFAPFVKHLFPGQKAQRLSQPAMETLAIVAYRQPITKSAMEAVRGVSCDGMLQKLLDRELIKIGGRADLPGRPLLYETTELFYEHFGVKSIDELPHASELRSVPLPSSSEDHPQPAKQLHLGNTPSSD